MSGAWSLADSSIGEGCVTSGGRALVEEVAHCAGPWTFRAWQHFWPTLPNQMQSNCCLVRLCLYLPAMLGCVASHRKPNQYAFKLLFISYLWVCAHSYL